MRSIAICWQAEIPAFGLGFGAHVGTGGTTHVKYSGQCASLEQLVMSGWQTLVWLGWHSQLEPASTATVPPSCAGSGFDVPASAAIGGAKSAALPPSAAGVGKEVPELDRGVAAPPEPAHEHSICGAHAQFTAPQSAAVLHGSRYFDVQYDFGAGHSGFTTGHVCPGGQGATATSAQPATSSA